MRNLLLKFSLIFAAVIIAIVLTEVFLRLFTKPPENFAKLQASSLFIQENKPNAEFDYGGKDFDKVHIVMNSYGFRDSEFRKEKETGVIRIAVLGDSFEEALQVDLSDTWQTVMASRLSQEPDKKVETYNFGVSGYGTDQEWLTLREKVWQFNPDMVILAFSPNDVGDVYKNKLIKEENGAIKAVSLKDRSQANFLGRTVRQFYLYYYLASFSQKNHFSARVFNKIRVNLLGFPKDERFYLSDAQLVNRPFDIVASQKNPPKEVADSWKIVELLIADMLEQSSKHGAQFLLVTNTVGFQVYNQEWESLKNQYGIPSDSVTNQMNLTLGEIANRLNIPFYDSRDDALLWVEQNGRIHLQLDGHYNKGGHLFMGTKVADYILSHDLLPKD